MKNNFLLSSYLSLALLLTSCSNAIPEDNKILKDKMVACSASLGTKASISLRENIEKNFSDGKISSNFNDGAYNIFNSLEEFPASDRIKLYQDYIRCINNLNVQEKTALST